MERLEQALEHLAERADRLPTETLIDRVERELDGAGVIVHLPGRPEPVPARRWRGPAAAVVAFAVVLAVAGGMWLGGLLLGDDPMGSTPTAATTPPTTAGTVPATTIPLTTTTTTGPSSPTTLRMDAVVAARALIPAVEQAFDDGDPGSLPWRSGAEITLSGMGLWFAGPDANAPVPAAREQLEDMLAWEHSLGLWVTFLDCTDEGAAGTVEITCAVEHGNVFLDRTGTTAVGQITFRVADGRIVALFDRRSAEEFYDVYGAKWTTFVLRDHPDLARSMFTERSVPILTEESAALHAGLIDEWAESWGL